MLQANQSLEGTVRTLEHRKQFETSSPLSLHEHGEVLSRFVRATARVLAGLSLADGTVHPLEQRRIEQFIVKFFKLPEKLSRIEVEAAIVQVMEHSSEAIVPAATFELRSALSEKQKRRWISALWDVAESDDHLDDRELRYIDQFSAAIGVAPAEGQIPDKM